MFLKRGPKPEKPYHLRLADRFVVYDPGRGEHLWREWCEGEIVADPKEIELLTARGAPVERLEDPTPPPIPKLK
jgi:hypothetical protein